MLDRIREAARLLESARIPSPRLEAEVLLAHTLGMERIDLYKSPERVLSPTEMNQYMDVIARRCGGAPTAYLRKKKEFYSRDFQVGPGVLIPRSETELLVEEGLNQTHGRTSPYILELGTGSGAIIVSLLAGLPKARGVATDISRKALEYAIENTKKHNLSDRIEFLEGDLFAPVPASARFDLIVSNPPYIPSGEITNDLRFEPLEALDGGPDGLAHVRKILADACRFMKPNGCLLLEIGGTNRNFLDEALEKYKGRYSAPVFKKDLAGHDRILVFTKRQSVVTN